METILITGVAGFIGHATAKKLLDEGQHIVGVDNMNDYYDPRLKSKRLEELIDHSEKFNFKLLDITQKSEVEKLFKEFNISKVIHLAAQAGVRYSIENPQIYIDTNISGLLNILESMKNHKVMKLVMASTSSLYASEEMPFKEDSSVNRPISPYSATKKAAEALTYTYHHLFGIDVSILRYFTVYGSGSRPDMAQFRIVKSLYENKPFVIYGDGSQARDFTHVEDIADGTIKALKPLGYEIINLGGGQNPISLKEFISEFEKESGKELKLDYVQKQNADMETTYANIDKAKKLLNWSPQICFSEGVSKIIKDYQENLDFYESIHID